MRFQFPFDCQNARTSARIRLILTGAVCTFFRPLNTAIYGFMAIGLREMQLNVICTDEMRIKLQNYTRWWGGTAGESQEYK